MTHFTGEVKDITELKCGKPGGKGWKAHPQFDGYIARYNWNHPASIMQTSLKIDRHDWHDLCPIFHVSFIFVDSSVRFVI